MTDQQKLQQQLREEGRRAGKQFLEVFYVEYWLEHDFDDLLVEWQVQEENRDKFLPLLLFSLLRENKRDVVKRLYLERYHERGVLPEWDCVPMFEELESFIFREDSFFEERMEYSLVELFDSEWRDTVDVDVTLCDFEMFPVTQLLTSDF